MEARCWCFLWCVSSPLKMEVAHSCEMPVNFCQNIRHYPNRRRLFMTYFLNLIWGSRVEGLGKVGYWWIWRLSGSHYTFESILDSRFHLFVRFVVSGVPFRTNNISARMDSILLRGHSTGHSLLNFLHLSSLFELLGTSRTLDHADYVVTV